MPTKPTKPKAIEIFRHGTHTPMEGSPITFTASQVSAMVRNYDPAVFRAPIVVGHPKTDDPAYGWVESVALSADGKVLAQPEADTLEPQFAAMVGAGRFRKVSVALFPPTHPANPKPGEFYLKHVGFLGAAAPAVSGLKPAEFSSDAAAGLVEFEFGSVDTWSLKRILRGLRDYLVEKEGAEKGDEIVPGYALDSLELTDPPANAGPCYATATEEDPMPTPNATDTAREAAFAERDTALNAREAELKKREEAAAKAAADARTAAAASFADSLVAAGKLKPANREQLVVALAAVDAIDAPVEFAEGDGKKTEAPGAILRRLLSDAKPFVAFGAERATPDTAPEVGSIAGFSAPEGSVVDAGEAAIHAKAVAHQKAHAGVSYADAVQAVSAG